MLTLHNKDFTTKYGTINTTIEAFVEEERNGLFELSFIMLNTDSLFNYIKEDNIVVVNANDTLLNQKFRIYMTRKLMNNRVEVFARHISFDLMYDYIDSISFENQSCEYALNSLFRGSQFSKHYKGYSDIVNAQNYSMSMVNVLEAIGGKEGSIIDTFGTGAELLRDNENIHVLNKRGYDNSVSIEYKKNLTGFELEEDTTGLVTRILPYAKYTPEGGEEVIVKASFVDSPLIANYSHPFVKAIDYTDKFEEGEEVTTSKLITFAQNEYKVNKVDIPKQNFKIEFIPLSKCLGYEPFKDSISLCDTVTIKDTRYNINTQAKVIKTIFNVLKNRYEAIELGEPKTSLGDIVGSNDSSKGEQGPPGPQGPPGADGDIGDFPNSLPSTPIVTTKVYGFSNIEISWTFENKVYYQYEVYASKEVDFAPNVFNLIHSGQTSTYMYQAKPNETWYFKVCAINTHNNRTNFGSAYATTTKVDDLSNYVGEMAIGDALIGELNLGRGWVGELKGNYIDAKQLSVTDGNGKRTLDIDSFGNVNLDVASLKINSYDVATQTYVKQIADSVEIKAESSKLNLVQNSNGYDGINYWHKDDGLEIRTIINYPSEISKGFKLVNGNRYDRSFYSSNIYLEKDIYYTLQIHCSSCEGSVLKGFSAFLVSDNETVIVLESRIAGTNKEAFKVNANGYYKLRISHNGASSYNGSAITLEDILITKGVFVNKLEWKPCTDDASSLVIKSNEIKSEVNSINDRVGIAESTITQQAHQIATKVDVNGVVSTVTQNAGQIITNFSQDGEVIIKNGNLSIQNNANEKMLWTDGGRLKTSGIDVYGENDGTFSIYGNGNKGIEIRSNNDQIAYLDFSRDTSKDFHMRIALDRNELDVLGSFIAPQFEFKSANSSLDYATFFKIVGHLTVTGSYPSKNINEIKTFDVGETLSSLIEQNEILKSENFILKEQQIKQEEYIINNLIATTENYEMLLSLFPNQVMNFNQEDLKIVDVYINLIEKGHKTLRNIPSVIKSKVIEKLKTR